MKFRHGVKWIAVLVIVAGLGLLAPMGYFWLQQKNAVAGASTLMVPAVAPLPPETSTLITGYPVSLEVPSVKVKVPVVDGTFDSKSQQWSLELNKAHYALMTMQPNNETGNTFIYGHYRPEVFAYLHHVKPGAQAQVVTANKYRFTYTFRSSQTVDPTDTSIFTYEGKPQLTIQTCTGTWMQNRELYYFDFTSVEKIE